MKYPAINITEKSWKGKDDELDSFIFFDEFNYNGDTSTFEKYFLNKKICDSDGNIHQIIGRTKPNSTWRRVFSFLPNVYKCEYQTKAVNESLTLQELRVYLLDRVSDLEQNEFSQKWKTDLQKASTFEEMILL